VSIKRDFSRLIRRKEVWVLTGLYFCAGGCYDTVLVWLPSILQAQGAGLFEASLIASMLPLGFLVSSVAVGVLSDRLGLRKPLITVMGAVSGPILFLAGTTSGGISYTAAFLAGLCTVGVLTLVLTIPVELKPLAPFLSSALGIIATAGNLGSFLLPPLVGQLRDISGTFLLSITVLAVMGEGMLILSFLLPETGRKHKIDA
jgi:NNP family nitrate/nitrite transporter-like MFS transporter